MKNWKEFLYFSILTFLCIVFLSYNTNNPIKIDIKKGILDLSTIENTLKHPIPLEGIWKFYWQKMIQNNEKLKKEKPECDFIHVPVAWNKQKEFKSYPPYGYGTYHLTILHSPQTVGKIMYIKMPFTFTSYSVYINGRLAARSGFVAETKEHMIPNQLPAIIQFEVKAHPTDIFIQVANFQQRNGGILNQIYYGTPSSITYFHNTSTSFQLFMLAAFFVIAVYHLAFYIINKSKNNIFLSLFSLIVGLRILLINEMLFIRVFNPPWGINFRLSYLTMTLSSMSFLHFLNNMYPKKVNKLLLLFLDIYFSFFSIFICVAPLHDVSFSLIYIQLALLFVFVYSLIILINETSDNLITKRLFYFGLFFCFGCFINEVLYSHQFLRTYNTSHIGILVFIITQSLISFEEYINQQKRLIILSNEIETAKTIQQNILVKTPPDISRARIDVHYLPINNIGGDFYHFFQIDTMHTGILLADVGSQGIPASIIATTLYIAATLQIAASSLKCNTEMLMKDLM